MILWDEGMGATKNLAANRIKTLLKIFLSCRILSP